MPLFTVTANFRAQSQLVPKASMYDLKVNGCAVSGNTLLLIRI